MSDSSYSCRTRHRRTFIPIHPSYTASLARPAPLDIVEDAWASATLSDDEIDISPQYDLTLAQLLEDGTDGMSADALIGSGGAMGDGPVDVAVASSAHSGAAAEAAAERRRKVDTRWNDLALDRFDPLHVGPTTSRGMTGSTGQSSQRTSNTNTAAR